MSTRIAVVEDHALVASALAGALELVDGLEVVGTAPSVPDAVAMLRQRRPDVALVDLRLGAASALDHLAELRAAAPHTRLLVLTAWASEPSLDQALAGGACGLLSKAQPLDELVDGVRRAAAGEIVVCPTLLDALVRRATGRCRDDAPDPRDVEVLELLADAWPTARIARSLCLSEHTVRNRIRGCMAKLGTHSRVETVVEATRRGWLLPREPVAAASR